MKESKHRIRSSNWMTVLQIAPVTACPLQLGNALSFYGKPKQAEGSPVDLPSQCQLPPHSMESEQKGVAMGLGMKWPCSLLKQPKAMHHHSP